MTNNSNNIEKKERKKVNLKKRNSLKLALALVYN